LEQQNTFIGGNAGEGNVSGNNNVFIGYVAGTSNSTGGQNTYVGRFAGQNTSTNTFCTFLGYDARQPDGTSFTNSMALGAGARVTSDNYIAIGNTNITSILDFILKLRPVSYQVETNRVASFLGETEHSKSRNSN